MSEELKPCPFCGGRAAFGTVTYSSETVLEQNWGQDTFNSVNCISCGTCNRGLVGFRTKDEAATHWNTRANPEGVKHEAINNHPCSGHCGDQCAGQRQGRDEVRDTGIDVRPESV